MAVNLLGKFQTREFSYWKGLTKDNHLGAIFQKAPQKATNLMVQLLAYQRGKTLDTLLNQFPTREFENDEEYTWEVIGSSRRNIPLLEARDEDGVVVEDNGKMIGAGTAPFYLVFPEDWFADGEFIVGNLNEVYQFRVLGDARMEGTNAVYKVELAGGNTEGVPAERLLAGEKFSIEAAFVESELSRKVGDVRFNSSVAMRNEFSTIRIQHKVPGNKINKKLAVGIPVVDNGKVTTMNMWMHYVDYEVEQQFSDYKNNALAFGRSNRNANGEYMNVGKSGVSIKTGAGLYEQMEVANTMYYNQFSLKLIEDALYELSAAKLGMGDRYFLIKTGERGAIQFHKAVLKEVSGWSQFTLNGDALGIVQKTQSNLHSNALSAGFQFVEYKAPNGVRVKIDVDPYYDDPVRNKIQHPLGGPAFSYRYDIMDIGTMDQPNIFKCAIKGDTEYRGYQWGLRNPFTGEKNNPYMSFDEDAAVIHKMATFGICVLDPTRTLSLVPAVLAA
nr:MAG TPA: major capsid protein [Crassvirales sp.]